MADDNKNINNNNTESIPESFYCPLTHEVMVDPVVDSEGNSYERSAIEQWLKKDATSPITRTPLLASSLAPNRALRETIETHLKQFPAKANPTPQVNTANAPKNDNAQVVGPETVQLQVIASKTKESTEHDVLVTIKPPAGTSRTPVDICCVIDISGSMGGEAKLRGAGGELESHGLSLLDIVKHAVKTISHSLNIHDRLAIVVYSTKARVEMDLTFVDAVARKTVEAKLDKLYPEDTTNIWDGLEQGLNLLRKGAKPGRLASLLLLTDGWPNVCPPRGEVAMFKRYKDQHQLSCTVSTFGFGYSLNSELLNDIASEGHGMFAFIPDSSFVGTAFVNATSNLLVTMGTNVQLSLEPQNGASIVSVMGDHKTTVSSWGTLVNLPSVQYGQNLDVVVKMTIPDTLEKDQSYLTASLKFSHWNFTQDVQLSVPGVNRSGSLEVGVQRRRSALVEAIKKLIASAKLKDNKETQRIIADLVEDLKTGTDPREQGLLGDVTGQIQEAVSKEEYFKKWGVHYLPSLRRAHQLQQSNNFKDVGIQFYGGELFQKLRDEIDDIFCKLPPPKKSIVPTTTSSSSGSRYTAYNKPATATATATARNFSMATYHSSAGPCFAGTSLVLMADGTHKCVKDVVRGDKVATLGNTSAEVLCVLKTHCHGNKTDLVEMDDGLLVTPYHPIRLGGKWYFPCDVKQPTLRECPAIYSFALKEDSSDHVMIINGVECVTLGHNYVDDDVVKHAYFGTRKVVEDLRKMRGWGRGVVELYAGRCLVKDPVTGLVCGLYQDDVSTSDDVIIKGVYVNTEVVVNA